MKSLKSRAKLLLSNFDHINHKGKLISFVQAVSALWIA